MKKIFYSYRNYLQDQPGAAEEIDKGSWMDGIEMLIACKNLGCVFIIKINLLYNEDWLLFPKGFGSQRDLFEITGILGSTVKV